MAVIWLICACKRTECRWSQCWWSITLLILSSVLQLCALRFFVCLNKFVVLSAHIKVHSIFIYSAEAAPWQHTTDDDLHEFTQQNIFRQLYLLMKYKENEHNLEKWNWNWSLHNDPSRNVTLVVLMFLDRSAQPNTKALSSSLTGSWRWHVPGLQSSLYVR